MARTRTWLLAAGLLLAATPALVSSEGTGTGCIMNTDRANTACTWGAPANGLQTCSAAARDVSPLYGCWGGYYKAGGRLPYDWSYVGYHQGSVPLPANLKIVANIKTNYGAKGDGRTDDTAAFEKAFKYLRGPGALYIPPGKYVITRPLTTSQGNFVLLGAGRDKTTLYFPKSLTQIFGNKYREGGACCNSDWSHSGAFITFASMDNLVEGGRNTNLASKVTKDAAKGQNKIVVDKPWRLKPGHFIKIHAGDPGDNSLVNMFWGAGAGGKNMLVDKGRTILGEYDIIRFYTKVLAVNGNTITLERNLPFPLLARWNVRLFFPKVRITEAGIQDLRIEFAPSVYKGHLKEDGYNAIFFRMTQNTFIRRVDIVNADSGIYLWGAMHTTVTDVTVSSNPGRGNKQNSLMEGHRAIWLEHGAENLVTKFYIHGRWQHDLSVSSFEQGSVFSSGWGSDLNLDFHRSAPYGNLYTDLNFGRANRVFVSSGGANNGVHAGAYNTMWNIYGYDVAKNPINVPYDHSVKYMDDTLGPLFNFIGMAGMKPRAGTPPYGWYIETFNNKGLAPANLHLQMLKNRLGFANYKKVTAQPLPAVMTAAEVALVPENATVDTHEDIHEDIHDEVPPSAAQPLPEELEPVEGQELAQAGGEAQQASEGQQADEAAWWADANPTEADGPQAGDVLQVDTEEHQLLAPEEQAVAAS